MAEDEEMDIDPSIAAAMGFAGFGMQTAKKRKYDSNNTYVDPDVATAGSTSKGKGANNAPLGARVKETGGSRTAKEGTVSTEKKIGTAPGRNADGSLDLEALRKGVKNDNGDMVYFLPSFIEDPWKDLRKT